MGSLKNMREALSLHRSQMEFVFVLPLSFPLARVHVTQHRGVSGEKQHVSSLKLKGSCASGFFLLVVMKFFLRKK